MDYILKIKELMKLKKLTQNDIAKLIHKNRMTVNNYLVKKTKLDVDTFLDIAEALKVKPSVFFKEENGNYPLNDNIDYANEDLVGYENKCSRLEKENEMLKEMLTDKRELLEDKKQIINFLKSKK